MEYYEPPTPSFTSTAPVGATGCQPRKVAPIPAFNAHLVWAAAWACCHQRRLGHSGPCQCTFRESRVSFTTLQQVNCDEWRDYRTMSNKPQSLSESVGDILNKIYLHLYKSSSKCVSDTSY